VLDLQCGYQMRAARTVRFERAGGGCAPSQSRELLFEIDLRGSAPSAPALSSSLHRLLRSNVGTAVGHKVTTVAAAGALHERIRGLKSHRRKKNETVAVCGLRCPFEHLGPATDD
jgi:hypothetical protein